MGSLNTYDPNSSQLIPVMNEMVGAQGSIAGIGGLVPQPLVGDENKFLKGDGTWGEGSSNFVGTMSEWNDLSLQEKIKYETADIESDEPVVTYTITYNANGGSGSMAADTKNQDEPYTIVANEFAAPTNTVFMRWNTASDGTGTDYVEGATYAINANLTLYAIWDYALKFSSDGNFTLATNDSQKYWNGTMYYSTDNGTSWDEWSGTTALSGTASQPLYVKGINNTTITRGDQQWQFTGKYITGNIETLLDYEDVTDGQHPTMQGYCFGYMFQGCTTLVIAPQLPAVTLLTNCYDSMFKNCTSLTTIPKLPATTLAQSCYYSMFSGCSALKLSATQTGDYQYPYRIPLSGTGTDATNALLNMFNSTGGTFTGTPTINTTYYTDHEAV